MLGVDVNLSILLQSAKAFTIHTLAEFPERLQQMAQELNVRNENLIGVQSIRTSLDSKDAQVNLAEYNPLFRLGLKAEPPNFSFKMGNHQCSQHTLAMLRLGSSGCYFHTEAQSSSNIFIRSKIANSD